MRRSSNRAANVLLGITRIACGRADGLAFFDSTSQAFLSSLAPLMGFPVAGALLESITVGPRPALTGLAMTLCILLTPAVVSYEVARAWKRSDAWIRFATAFNWCEWILPVIGCLALVPLSLAVSVGLDGTVATLGLLGGLAAYGLWLQWFLARHALRLTVWRAGGLVIAMNLGTGAAVAGPHLLMRGLG